MIDGSTLETVREKVQDILDRMDLELWDIEYKMERGSGVLRVYIDKADKVTIDDCAAVSERVSLMLDVEDIITEPYNLEVSSPGMDRKLVTSDHFNRYLNRLVSLKLHNEVVGRKKFTGRLTEVKDESILLYDENEKQEHNVERNDIKEARLVIEFKP